MNFTVKNVQQNIVGVARGMGYIIIDTNENEYNLVRKIYGDNYPRFHAYVNQHGRDYLFSLHLDQKKPSYEARGVHDHNGEYFGPVVENEADRIKSILANISE